MCGLFVGPGCRTKKIKVSTKDIEAQNQQILYFGEMSTEEQRTVFI